MKDKIKDIIFSTLVVQNKESFDKYTWPKIKAELKREVDKAWTAGKNSQVEEQEVEKGLLSQNDRIFETNSESYYKAEYEKDTFDRLSSPGS